MKQTTSSSKAPRRGRKRLRLVVLLLVLALVSVWATLVARQSPPLEVIWIGPGFRPALYNRGAPLSEAFQSYLTTHFPDDPSAVGPEPPLPIVTEMKAKNCILLIGDGMGLAHVYAASLAAYGVGGRLAIQRMPIVGLMATHSASSLVTDSGGSATAMATGVASYNGAVAVDPSGRPLESFFITARRDGKRTGVVATVSVTHATPATFIASARLRSMQSDIAPQLIERDTNVILGGGLAYFVPAGHESGLSLRRDGRDVLREAFDRGYQLAFQPQELPALSGDHVLGLFALRSMPPASAMAPPTLVAMTDKALELLDQGDEGFCLMVEGSQIDWRAHQADFEGVLWETLEFERAVARCLEFAQQDGETLVIVTADHETGGLALAGEGKTGLSAYWSGGTHSALAVPLFAYGPGCLEFAGSYRNTDVAVKFATVLGLDDFPALREEGGAAGAPPADALPPGAAEGFEYQASIEDD